VFTLRLMILQTAWRLDGWSLSIFIIEAIIVKISRRMNISFKTSWGVKLSIDQTKQLYMIARTYESRCISSFIFINAHLTELYKIVVYSSWLFSENIVSMYRCIIND
jgi:hypothetical protein